VHAINLVKKDKPFVLPYEYIDMLISRENNY